MWAKITNYFKGVRRELIKVSWPTRSQVIFLTIVVVISIGIAMGIVAGIDYVLSIVVQRVFIK
jgi:preprotein translocase subunit SecE